VGAVVGVSQQRMTAMISSVLGESAATWRPLFTDRRLGWPRGAV